jgi:hypothetical protein
MPNYLNRRPKTARRVKTDVRPTEAQKRARVINFALFRLKNAKATADIISCQLSDTVMSGLEDLAHGELRIAFGEVNVAAMCLKDAIRALEQYNAHVKKARQDAKQADKKGTKP